MADRRNARVSGRKVARGKNRMKARALQNYTGVIK